MTKCFLFFRKGKNWKKTDFPPTMFPEIHICNKGIKAGEKRRVRDVACWRKERARVTVAAKSVPHYNLFPCLFRSSYLKWSQGPRDGQQSGILTTKPEPTLVLTGSGVNKHFMKDNMVFATHLCCNNTNVAIDSIWTNESVYIAENCIKEQWNLYFT